MSRVKWMPWVDPVDRKRVNAPEDGARCIVITPGGDERALVYAANLWWLPDRSMYVYFAPVFWRVADEEEWPDV